MACARDSNTLARAFRGPCIAARAVQTFFDEANVDYEAARLARHRVVLVYWMNDARTIGLEAAKGRDDVLRYLAGEDDLPNFEVVAAPDREAARALMEAFKRRDQRPALRVVG